jgi:hypothetical protein
MDPIFGSSAKATLFALIGPFYTQAEAAWQEQQRNPPPVVRRLRELKARRQSPVEAVAS